MSKYMDKYINTHTFHVVMEQIMLILMFLLHIPVLPT